MLPPGTMEGLLYAFGSFSHLFPGFLAVLVGVACFFVPYDVSVDDGCNMLFFVGSRMVAIILVIVGAFALWQA